MGERENVQIMKTGQKMISASDQLVNILGHSGRMMQLLVCSHASHE